MHALHRNRSHLNKVNLQNPLCLVGHILHKILR